MTAKEKAKDIYDSYWYCLMQSDINKRHYFSKECALITVDEMIKEVEHWQPRVNYLNEVKQEIQKI